MIAIQTEDLLRRLPASLKGRDDRGESRDRGVVANWKSRNEGRLTGKTLREMEHRVVDCVFDHRQDLLDRPPLLLPGATEVDDYVAHMPVQQVRAGGVGDRHLPLERVRLGIRR